MAAQRRIPLYLGFFPSSPSQVVTTLALNAAATWLALSFVPAETKTLARVRAFASALTGSLAATDVSCDIYSDAGAGPVSSLGSSSVVTSALAANAWGEWGGAGSGFNLALTAGSQYWAVWKNLNGTPASNFPTFRFGAASGVLPVVPAGSQIIYGWNKRHSADSGATWAAANVVQGGCLRLEYTDGTFDGFPIQNIAANTVDSIYSARETGVKFTTPAGPPLKLRGLSFYSQNSGTPTGNLRGRLYSGSGSTPTLVATTAAAPKANVQSTLWSPLYFAATQTLTPSTVYRVTLGETTQSDASTNRYHCFEYTFDSDSNSLALLPMDGTAVKTYTTDGVTFAETSNVVLPFALILDTDGEFGVTGVSRARVVNAGGC